MSGMTAQTTHVPQPSCACVLGCWRYLCASLSICAAAEAVEGSTAAAGQAVHVLGQDGVASNACDVSATAAWRRTTQLLWHAAGCIPVFNPFVWRLCARECRRLGNLPPKQPVWKPEKFTPEGEVVKVGS